MAKPAPRKSKFKKKPETWSFSLGKDNLRWFLIGVATIVVGYILLATGITEEPAVPQGRWNNPLAIYVAPALLVIGYCIIIPYSLLKTFKNTTDKE
ncbi:MAG: DUF3098 domain-containing protein [Ignavibacteria bacterium]|nr:DUF3098 domain-containing protein [Ignavibacteria bacterium]